MVGFCLLVPLLVLSVCGSNARRARIEDALQEIFFRLYSGDPEQYADARLYEVRNLVARMEPDKPTVFYLHGYTGSARSRDVLAVVSGYLERGDHNVIAVDWSPIAGKNYPSVVSSAKSVGEAVAGAIDEMVDQGLTSRSIHVVGHSMGAQVAGYAGRRTSFELSRITGLDPAGPFFNFLEAHLQASDASFVDTIHTDAGFYGINRASGAASFYPNGGRRVQPGCPSSYELSSPEDYCSHHRSWLFYAESLRKEDSFLATNCSSYRSFARGACDDAAKVPMGFATPGNARGVFFLTTKSEPPFGMQMDGAVSTSSRADRNINNADKKEASNSRETGTGAARAVEKNLIGRFIV
ncbi:lipase member H-A-like isoform X2 [Nasonia vitripennis]|uniref:phospholipase A1 n=1 Tax=Nasonia vitripennis TaxID=7425 RepID=A0A7M7IQZ8_NASVI|nr:lipase member H-A-like isoform X2 [Nasonia vitripennis]